jgi:hypothetical protein
LQVDEDATQSDSGEEDNTATVFCSPDKVASTLKAANIQMERGYKPRGRPLGDKPNWARYSSKVESSAKRKERTGNVVRKRKRGPDTDNVEDNIED